VAAHASAAPEPAVFRLTIEGTARQTWTYTARPVEEGDCVRRETTDGARTVTFRTTRPTLVRILNGRMLAADVRRLAGTVTSNGANITEKRCGVIGIPQPIACAETKRTFAGASVRVWSPRTGVVSLAGPGRLRLRRANCPREPVGVERRPLGPVPIEMKFPREALMAQRLARITLSGSRTGRTNYGAPESGRLRERSDWKLTFVRVRP
jgi:hypothetical protein